MLDSAIKKFGTAAVLLDGVADFIRVAHNAALDVGSIHDYCVEMWIYLWAYPPGSVVKLLEKYNFTTIIPFEFEMDQFGIFRCYMGSFDGSVTAQITGTTVVPLNTWTHIAMSRNGADVRLFLNGIQESTTDSILGSTDGGDNTGNIAIGAFDDGTSSTFMSFDEFRWTVGNSRYTSNFTPPAEPFWNPYVIQQSFRWYNDNGSETTMTAAVAQDADLSGSSGTNYILRMQLDATGNPNSTAWRLEYKKSTDSVYVPVLLAAGALPTFLAANIGIGSTTTASPAWPVTVLPNDIGLLVVESAGGEPVTLSTPAGFVACPDSPVATGAGTAGTQLSVFWCRATADVMPNPVVADPGDHVWARIFCIRGCIAEGSPFNASANAVKAAATAAYSAPAVTTTQDNCLIVNIISHDLDNAGNVFSAQANASLGTVTERLDGGTTQGNGGGIGVITGTLATAGASGNTTGTVTSSINAMLTLAMRPQTTPIIMSASANVTAGGEATTARLTAPAGKSTSDFVTGRMWDNENGTDAIDITADDYTELAWCIKAQSPAAGGDTYQFRVTMSNPVGELLEYYAVTPALTI